MKLGISKKRFLVCDGSYCCPQIKFKLYDNRYSQYIAWDTFDENKHLTRSIKNSIETKETWDSTYDSNGKLVMTNYYKNGKLKAKKNYR